MISLKQWVETHGQSATARHLRVTHAAIWQMLANSREIHAIKNEDGTFDFVEFKVLARNVKIE